MMATQIIFLTNKNTLIGGLTHFFTGCYSYHVGIVIQNKFYDMYWMRRKRIWFNLYSSEKTIRFDSPVEVSPNALDQKILNYNPKLSMKDFFLFAIRNIYHFLGINTRNIGGQTASEQVIEDLIESGWESPWKDKNAPKRTCDLIKVFMEMDKPTIH